jgi:hypothetical protein
MAMRMQNGSPHAYVRARAAATFHHMGLDPGQPAGAAKNN